MLRSSSELLGSELQALLSPYKSAACWRESPLLRSFEVKNSDLWLQMGPASAVCGELGLPSLERAFDHVIMPTQNFSSFGFYSCFATTSNDCFTQYVFVAPFVASFVSFVEPIPHKNLVASFEHPQSQTLRRGDF